LAAGYGRGLLGIDAESALFRVYQFATQEDDKLVFTGPLSGLVDHVIDLLGSQGVKCAWMVGSVLAPYAGISVGTGLVIFTDGTGSEVGITIIGLSAKGIQNQASFRAETFKC
jgi:hypothetical protein